MLTYIFVHIVMATNDVTPSSLIVTESTRQDSHTVNKKFLEASRESVIIDPKFIEADNQRLNQAARGKDLNNNNTGQGSGSHNTGVVISGKEVRHVVLLKVHKTASSTAQNVFLRFGDSRNLTFILAHTNGESGWLNVISYVNSITKDNVVPPPSGLHYDILCCHVIYNKTRFSAVFPADTVYIGIVREPFSRFQSAVKYFSPNNILGIPGDNPVSTFVKNPLKYEKSDPRMSQTNNRMAVEFGFPLDLFPGGSNNSCTSCINDYLSQIDRDFKFIIISELFEESMVYMKRILHWKTKDIFYLDQNVAPSKYNVRKKMQDSDREYLKQFLTLDIALYNFSMNRFREQTNKEGLDFKDEVASFKAMRKQVNAFCNNKKAGTIEFGETKHSNKFTVDIHDCQMFHKHEKDVIQKQRMRMYGTLNN